jgi:uncharacterized protein
VVQQIYIKMYSNKKSALIQYKYTPIDLSQDIDYENRKVRGVLSKFDIVDSDRDVIRPGAFIKSINERGPKASSNRQIKYLLQHDIKTPAGVFVNLYEEQDSLVYEGYIERTANGDATLERIKIGFYREHSFGYNYVSGKCDFKWVSPNTFKNPMNIPLEMQNGNVEIYECKELNLFEGSIVTFGANSETEFLPVKSEADKDGRILALKELYDYLIKQAPNYEYELALRANFQKEASLIKSLAVVKSTKESDEPTIPKGIINYQNLNDNFKLN